MQLQATLCLSQQSLLLIALVDSGAEGNFLDEGFALQTGISCEPLDTPLEANARDRRLLAQVTHLTEPLILILSGNHRERLQFHLISLPYAPLVLGHSQLQQHNPHIDW